MQIDPAFSDYETVNLPSINGLFEGKPIAGTGVMSQTV